MSVSDTIIDGIEIIANDFVEKAGYNKTIQAQILSCEDATIGMYRCRYQDAIFYAYTNNADLSFGNGAYVYILVPNGDMSKEKTILGTTNKLGINYISQAEGDQAYDLIGNNTIISEDKYYLDTNNINYKYILYDANKEGQQDISINTEALKQYIKQSSSIIVGATIKTNIIPKRQFRGHYGITYNLRFQDAVASDQEVIRSYTVNEDNMIDNPYRLIYETRQYEIFDVDGPNFKRLESIQIFNRDFPEAQGRITNGKLLEGDIEISKLQLCGAVRMSDQEVNGIAISFYTPQGSFFSSEALESDYKKIVAQVRIKGKLASAAQNIPFYWGSENIGVGSQSEYYNKKLGLGWKCLNQKNIITNGDDDTEPVVQWNPSGDTFILYCRDATARNNKFKVAIYYDGNVISKEINIQNLGLNTPDLTIESSGGTKFYYDIGHPTLTCKVNGGEPDGYTYSWAYVSNKNVFTELPETSDLNTIYMQDKQNYQDLLDAVLHGDKFANIEANNLIEKQEKVQEYNLIQRVQGNKIYDVQIRNITSFGTFKCSVYNENGIYLGTASIKLTNTFDGEDLYSLVINNGSATFQYNENGVAPNNKSLDIQQQIKALTFTIYDNLGQPISDEVVTKNCKIRWAVPIKETMINDSSFNGDPNGTDPYQNYIYYDNRTTLLYDIAQKYNIKNQRNQIRLTVDYKGMNLTAETQFSFVKQGQPGTNGTQYLVKLVPNTTMNNPPLWPVVTKVEKTGGSKECYLNYGIGNSNSSTNISGTLDSNKFFKAQLWYSGDLIWEGFTANDVGKDNLTHPISVHWEVLTNKCKDVVDDSLFTVSADGSIQYNKNKNLLDNNGKFIPYANIIKCTINWNQGEQTKSYYGTLPITVSQVSEGFKVYLKDYTGWRYAIYTSDGVLPQYDNSHPFEFICMQSIPYQDGEVDNNGNLITKYSWEDVSLDPKDHIMAYQIDSVGNYCYYNTNSREYVYINANLIEILKQELEKNQKNARPTSRYDGLCVNSAITCLYKQRFINEKNQESWRIVGKINVPIHFLLNKYGLSHLNEWDGNSVEIKEKEGYILAPQMGAGSKDEHNTFTGVLMGEVKIPTKDKTDIGLLGYSGGDRTFFLNSKNGSALFGKSGAGQITVDPSTNKAMIYSGNFWEDYDENTGLPSSYTYRNSKFQPNGNAKKDENGKKIIGAGLLIDLTTPEIYFGTGNFYVTADGYVHASKGGDIAGWKISNNSIYSNVSVNDGRITLCAGTYEEANNIVKGPGKIYSHQHTSLTTAKKGFYLSYDGLSIGTKFKVDVGDNLDGTNKGGVLRLGLGAVDPNSSSDHWIIDGKNSSEVNTYEDDGTQKFDKDGKPITTTRSRSFISYGEGTYFIPAGNNHQSKVYVGTDGISLGTKFSVDNSGNLISKKGFIGGWLINETKLTGGTGLGANRKTNITLDSSGNIAGGHDNSKNDQYTWEINSNGKANFNYLTANKGGSIGGWTIGPTSLSSGSMYISKGGSIGGENWSITEGGIANFKKLSGIIPDGLSVTVNGGGNISSGAGSIGSSSGWLGSGGATGAPLSWNNNGVSLNKGAKIGNLVIGKSGQLMTSGTKGHIYITENTVKATNVVAANFKAEEGDGERTGKSGKAIFSDGSSMTFVCGLCVDYQIKKSG